MFFFFNDTATTEIYTLSLHDALPISFSGVGTLTFEYRQNPTADWFLICENTTGTSYHSCSWNLTALSDGNQYQVRVRSNDTLGNLGPYDTATNITLDRTGPTTTIQDPLTGANIWGASYTVNATAADTYSPIGSVIFQYRANAGDTWKDACVAANGPPYFTCSWSLTGLADGNQYQLRANANDTLGNLGPYDTETSITIDNNGPQITLLSPNNGITDGDGNLVFVFTANDAVSGLSNCSLLINGTINKTNSTIAEGQNTFTLDNMTNGNYNWSVRCTDDFTNPNTNTSETRTFTVDIRYEMGVNVTTDKSQYEMGDELAEAVNIMTKVFDAFAQPLVADITLDIIKGNATSTWWNTSWKRRKAVSIKETAGVNQTEVRLNITIDTQALVSQGKMMASCADARFADTNKNEIPYYLVSGCGTQNTLFQIKANLTANETFKIYFYYSNPSATSKSDRGSTMADIIGETGSVSIANFTWSIVPFTNTYSSAPVVLATPVTQNAPASEDDSYIIPTISSTSTTSFNVTICEDNGDITCKPTVVLETLDYFVFDPSKANQYSWMDVGTVNVATDGTNTQIGRASCRERV